VKLLKSISSSMGNTIDFENLSETSGLKYNEVREILPLLEDTFVISLVKPFHKNLNIELRKNPKIYFVDCGIRNYLLENFDNLGYLHLYENFVFNQIRDFNPKYWRTTSKADVNFVVKDNEKIIPIEVKTKPKLTKSLRSFIDNYKPKKVFISNLKEINKKKIGNSKVYIHLHIYL